MDERDHTITGVYVRKIFHFEMGKIRPFEQDYLQYSPENAAQNDIDH